MRHVAQPVPGGVDMHGAADLEVDVLLVAASVDFAELGEVVERGGSGELVAAGLATEVLDGQPEQQGPLPVYI